MEYLSAYNKNPHSVTNKSPIELLLGRPAKNWLPEVRDRQPMLLNNENVLDEDRMKKDAAKEKLDLKRRARESSIEIGDNVLMEGKKEHKLESNFNPKKFKVISREGNKLRIQSDNNESYDRQASSLKKLHDQKEEKEVLGKRKTKPNAKYNDYMLN